MPDGCASGIVATAFAWAFVSLLLGLAAVIAECCQ